MKLPSACHANQTFDSFTGIQRHKLQFSWLAGKSLSGIGLLANASTSSLSHTPHVPDSSHLTWRLGERSSGAGKLAVIGRKQEAMVKSHPSALLENFLVRAISSNKSNTVLCLELSVAEMTPLGLVCHVVDKLFIPSTWPSKESRLFFIYLAIFCWIFLLAIDRHASSLGKFLTSVRPPTAQAPKFILIS